MRKWGWRRGVEHRRPKDTWSSTVRGRQGPLLKWQTHFQLSLKLDQVFCSGFYLFLQGKNKGFNKSFHNFNFLINLSEITDLYIQTYLWAIWPLGFLRELIPCYINNILISVSPPVFRLYNRIKCFSMPYQEKNVVSQEYHHFPACDYHMEIRNFNRKFMSKSNIMHSSFTKMF